MDAKTLSEFEKWAAISLPGGPPMGGEIVCAAWGIKHERAKLTRFLAAFEAIDVRVGGGNAATTEFEQALANLRGQLFDTSLDESEGE